MLVKRTNDTWRKKMYKFFHSNHHHNTSRNIAMLVPLLTLICFRRFPPQSYSSGILQQESSWKVDKDRISLKLLKLNIPNTILTSDSATKTRLLHRNPIFLSSKVFVYLAIEW